MSNTRVITRRGGIPKKLIEYVRNRPDKFKGYKVIILHVGTNWLSKKEEWALYLRMVNGQFTKEEYTAELAKLNPPPAIGDANRFREEYQELVDLIRNINRQATILVSAIIPRLWDNKRRFHIRNTYNRMLKEFNSQPNIFFIPSDWPFFTKSHDLKSDLFDYDGLHLSSKGAVVLRTFFCEKIDKALKNVLK